MSEEYVKFEDGITMTLAQRNTEEIKELKKTINSLSLFVHGKTLTPHGWKVERHEEIKQKAWDMYKKMQLLADYQLLAARKHKDFFSEDILPALKIAWKRAEGFYNFAKEKEKQDA